MPKVGFRLAPLMKPKVEQMRRGFKCYSTNNSFNRRKTKWKGN